MKTVGIILIVLQAISLLGGFPDVSGGAGYAAGFLLGYFAPGIIGVILLVKGIKKANEKEEAGEN